MVHLQTDGIQEFKSRRQHMSHVVEFKQQVIRLGLLVFVGTALALAATANQHAEANPTKSSIEVKI